MGGGRRDVNFSGEDLLSGSSCTWSVVYPSHFSRFYTGFSPVFSRYNGENGLIGSVKVWECDGKKGLEDFLKETKSCSRVMPQCKVSFYFIKDHIISAQRLLFSWGPGSLGEQLPEGTGIKVERGHYLLLQVPTHTER